MMNTLLKKLLLFVLLSFVVNPSVTAMEEYEPVTNPVVLNKEAQLHGRRIARALKERWHLLARYGTTAPQAKQAKKEEGCKKVTGSKRKRDIGLYNFSELNALLEVSKPKKVQKALNNALLTALKNGCEKAAKALIADGASLTCKDAHGFTPLMLAVKHCSAACVIHLCDTHEARVHKTDFFLAINDATTDDLAAITIAVQEGKFDIFRALLRYGAIPRLAECKLYDESAQSIIPAACHKLLDTEVTSLNVLVESWRKLTCGMAAFAEGFVRESFSNNVKTLSK